MELRSGQPYFLAKNKKEAAYAPLSSDTNADIVIIGGGISGAMMAYTLVKNGLTPVVIDKDEPGYGSTGASTALLQYEIDIPLFRLIEMTGRETALEAYRVSMNSLEMIRDMSLDIGYAGFRKCSSLYFAHDKRKKEDVKKEYEARSSAGFAVELLEAVELESRYGLRSEAGILSDNAGKIDPCLFTKQMHRYNTDHGVQIYTGTCISTVCYKKDGVEMVTDQGFRIRAKKLVYASGYETLDKIDLPVKLNATYVFASAPIKKLPGFFRDTVLWNTGEPYMYIREDEDRLIVGGRDETFDNAEKRDRLIEKKARELNKDLENLFPSLHVVPEYTWSGTFATTVDGLPFIGCAPAFPETYFALGFGGNGITFSAVAANIITGMIKKTAPAAAGLFRLDR